MSSELARYGLRSVTGDKYSAEFVVQAFRNHHVTYRTSELNKSQLYLELLPRICSREIELLDNERLIIQLSNLERRTRSGGNDVIDHSPGQHDDLSNVVAGVITLVSKPRIIVGGGFRCGDNIIKSNPNDNVTFNRRLMARVIAEQQAKIRAII